jgi:hypothetical protein
VSLSLSLVAVLAASPIRVEIFVPLCDSALIACGRGAAGDPRSLSDNLYWGAAYGAERFLLKSRELKLIRRTDAPVPGHPSVLRELELIRKRGVNEKEVQVVIRAYAGDRIDDALVDFLETAASNTSADLVVWAGHDRLMDVPTPHITKSAHPGAVAVLACSSETFFRPALDALGSRPIALTRSFMAPEAYLLEALIRSVAANGVDDTASMRDALVEAYAHYQHISKRAAATVFSRLD